MKTGSWSESDPVIIDIKGCFRGSKRRKLTAALDVVPKIRIRGAVFPLPHAPIWCGT